MTGKSHRPGINDTFRTRLKVGRPGPAVASRVRFGPGIAEIKKKEEKKVFDLATQELRRPGKEPRLHAMATKIAFATGDSSDLGIAHIEMILRKLIDKGQIKLPNPKRTNGKKGKVN